MGFLGAAVGLAGLMVTPVFGQETRDVQIIGGAWKTAPAAPRGGEELARFGRGEPLMPLAVRRFPDWF